MNLWDILGDIVLLLTACLFIGGLFSKLRQSPLVGYIIAGMLLGGPGSIDVVTSAHEIEAIAELGVALLLFSLGLEFSVKRLKQLGMKPLLGGVFQVTLTIVIGAVIAHLFDTGIRESIAFGVMISLSSTAVVLRLLMDRAELDLPHGRNSLAVLLTQDMAVVPLAILMTLLGGAGDLSAVSEQVVNLSLMIVLVVGVLYVVNLIAITFLGTMMLYHNRELTVLFAVAAGLGSAWAAHAAGLSPALGAFIAGMFLGSSVFATQIRSDVSSLRVILLTLFFGSAGMVADPLWILENWQQVLGVTALVTVGKLLIIWGIFQLLDNSVRVSAATGLCLAQIGEFAFVLGSIGLANGAVSESMYSLVVSVAILSFIISAFLVPFAPRFGNLVAPLFKELIDTTDSSHSAETPPEVVIIGFGPSGQRGAQPMAEYGEKVLVIDLNREGVRRARELGFRAQVGDARQYEILEHVQMSQARAIVITVPHFESTMTILKHVRQLAPHAHVLVRSRYRLHSGEFASAGAHVVVGDEEQVGQELALQLKNWLESVELAEN